MNTEINPCETCDKQCRYILFIDCPIWIEWAEKMKESEIEDE